MDRTHGSDAPVCLARTRRSIFPRLAARLHPSEFCPGPLPGAVEPAARLVSQDPLHLFVLPRQDQHGRDVRPLPGRFHRLQLEHGGPMGTAPAAVMMPLGATVMPATPPAMMLAEVMIPPEFVGVALIGV